ncbi:MAG: L-threonine 3-dehydrogenase, partial [Candidatus Neomarinimicrobiota bacterium]
GIDTRGLRFPGLISYKTLPGGGTTDYAVEIFYEAVKKGKYTCYLSRDTRLDMMYMPDAITAIIKLMEADGSKLKNRNAYNVTSMSVTPEEIAASIRRFMPNFEIEYKVDVVRQSIADSWPDSLDDSCARAEWGWQPEYSLERMTKDMLEKVSLKLKKMEEK